MIGFGLFAFTLVLAFRAFSHLGTLDGDAMRVAEPERPAPDHAAKEARA